MRAATNMAPFTKPCDDHVTTMRPTCDQHGTTSNSAVAANWTSSVLNTSGAAAVKISYIDSDPCYDLWAGIECSSSPWPVGTDDCGEMLDCAGLGWDNFNSTTSVHRGTMCMHLSWRGREEC